MATVRNEGKGNVSYAPGQIMDRNNCRSRWLRPLRVRTHQQSRVESNPIQSDSQRRGSDSVVQWPPRQFVRTSRVESSHMSLDAACFIFVSQTPVTGRDGRNGCREAYSLSKGPRGNLRRLAL